MRRTLFSVAIIGIGLAAGRFETGDGIPPPPAEEMARRNDALTRARVFVGGDFAPSRIDFGVDPNAEVVDRKLTSCKYKPDRSTGTTAKFDCVLKSGEKIKVKYGPTREIPSEIAGTRLMAALGFAADRVSPVETVRCYGCPIQPFHTQALIDMLGLSDWAAKRIDYSDYRDFENVSVERNFDGEAVEAGEDSGWAFFELKKIDPARGGASRGEVDALRLMAIFLHHWDNKTSNQRLVCADSKTADCAHPVVMIHDLGSEFGPKKVDLEKWKAQPIWTDASTCTVSMKHMPYGGGTFEDVQISEEGRRLVGDRLKGLSRAQTEQLFTVAQLDNVPQWTDVFQDKVRQIVERQPCPVIRKTSS